MSAVLALVALVLLAIIGPASAQSFQSGPGGCTSPLGWHQGTLGNGGYITPGAQLWSCPPSGNWSDLNQSYLAFDGLGSVALYTAGGEKIWSTNTRGSGANLFIVWPSGNMTLYAPGWVQVWTAYLWSGVNNPVAGSFLNVAYNPVSASTEVIEPNGVVDWSCGCTTHWQNLTSDSNTQAISMIDQIVGQDVLPISGTGPAWTDDGRIIYVSTTNQIMIASQDGSGAVQVGSLPFHGVMWPQLRNRVVAFGNVSPSDPGNQQGVWIMNEDGSGLHLAAPGAPPALSPDGSWFAYAVQTLNPNHKEVWRANANGSGAQQLTFPTDPNFPDANAPTVSGDGSTIAIFSGLESIPGQAGVNQSIYTWGPRNIATIPANGGPRTQVTKCTPVTIPQQLAALPPDGCIDADSSTYAMGANVIVYLQGNPASGVGTGLFAINPDGTGKVKISDTGGGGANPVRYVP